ncbi:MAG: hypothetical protein P4L82_22195 [Ancalomicrobiaceae bacterium]|nr:hypothetical protein [Ancalomicrobiaceae bacterium]
MRRGWSWRRMYTLAVALFPLFSGQIAAAREPINLWETLKLADALQGKVPDDDWRATERLVNDMARAVLLHKPTAIPPCNDLELLRKAHIVLQAGMPIDAILQKASRIGVATVIDGHRAELLFSCDYRTNVTVFRPWLDKAAIDARIVSLLATLITDDFDNPADDNKATIRQCLAAEHARNAAISAFCDGPASNVRSGPYFIGVSTSTHKWE